MAAESVTKLGCWPAPLYHSNLNTVAAALGIYNFRMLKGARDFLGYYCKVTPYRSRCFAHQSTRPDSSVPCCDRKTGLIKMKMENLRGHGLKQGEA